MSDLQVVVAVIDAAEILAQKLRDSENHRAALTQVIAAVKALRHAWRRWKMPGD